MFNPGNLLPTSDVTARYQQVSYEPSPFAAFFTSLSRSVKEIGDVAIGGVDTYAAIRQGLSNARSVAREPVTAQYQQEALAGGFQVQTVLVLAGVFAAGVGVLLLLRR